MILCKDVHALLHVISLVDWPKHVKFFFFFFFKYRKFSSGNMYGSYYRQIYRRAGKLGSRAFARASFLGIHSQKHEAKRWSIAQDTSKMVQLHVLYVSLQEMSAVDVQARDCLASEPMQSYFSVTCSNHMHVMQLDACYATCCI